MSEPVKEENKVQNIRIIKVTNGFIVVGPKSYIAGTEKEARERLAESFTDILAEFEKPMETPPTVNNTRPEQARPGPVGVGQTQRKGAPVV